MEMESRSSELEKTNYTFLTQVFVASLLYFDGFIITLFLYVTVNSYDL